MKASVVIVLLSVASGAYPGARSASTIRVSSESEFAAAVSALRDSGGTIMLLPHVFAGELVIGPRSSRRLRVVGAPGARVERLLLDHTQRVSLDGLTISPVTADASLTALSSRDVDVHGLQVTAEGTRYSASVALPGSSGVTIRRSVFTHCGDRSPRFVNCLWLRWASDVTVADSWFHDCLGCDFVHGRFGSRLTLVRNRFERTLPCQVGRRRCAHQDPVELFAGRGLRVIGNHFGVYKLGGAQLYLTNAIDDVTIANNVFVGIDPRVPGYRARVGLIVGSSHSPRVPHDVRIVNNTILTGATRTDGYLGSIRLSSRYGGLPRRERPIIANNVIGVLEVPHHVCSEARVSSSNVVLRGHACSGSDRVGAAALDRYGRPTASSRLLIGRADRRYAPATDAAGKPRDARPDVGAYESRAREGRP